MTKFTLPDFQTLVQTVQSPTSSDVEQALAASHRDIHDLAALISPAAEAFLPEMARRSARITAQRFGRTTQLYAPIYLSNFCTNRCAYCGFAANNRIVRRVLSFDEAEAEAEILYNRGFRHILLVSGEAENAVDVKYLETIALRLRDKFAAVSIEVQPLSTEDYARLFRAGITAVAVYQETPSFGKKNRLPLPAGDPGPGRRRRDARGRHRALTRTQRLARRGLSHRPASGLAAQKFLEHLLYRFLSTPASSCRGLRAAGCGLGKKPEPAYLRLADF